MKSRALAAAACISIATAPAIAADEALHLDLEEIVVTATPLARSLGETVTGASVLDSEALVLRAQGSIGETLRQLPGISATTFTPGASRPIIRGLGGDRIRVLDNGIGTIDASVTSVDHAVAVEPLFADRIEVVRGPAVLSYGSSGAGGVVNINNGRIPDAMPEDGADARVRLSHSTVNEGEEAAAGFTVGLGGSIALHGEAFLRRTENVAIPGSAASSALIAEEIEEEGPDFDPDEEFPRDRLPNTDIRSEGGTAGISYIFGRGFFGVSGQVLNSNYGIAPGGHEHAHGHEHGHGDHGDEHEHGHDDHGHDDHGDEHEHGHGEEGEDEIIRIDLEQVRIDVDGRYDFAGGPLDSVSLRVGYADYRHVELEGEESGTLFENEGVEGRIEARAREMQLAGGDLRMAFGTQFRIRDFSAVGEEAFVPPSDTEQIGVFALADWDYGPWLLGGGLRYEYTDSSTNAFVAAPGSLTLVEEDDGVPAAISKSINAVSISADIGYRLADGWYLGLAGHRTERAPAIEELFSFGAHLATNTFEIGDPTLGKEVSRGIEATLRGELGGFTAVINGFYTDYRDFIFERETGAEEDELPVFAFTAADASFRGFEAKLDYDFGAAALGRLGPASFALQAQADYVRATLSGVDGNNNLPRIPPFSALIAGVMEAEHLDLRFEGEIVAEQDEVADFELPTDGFAMVNAFLTLRPFGRDRDLAFDIQGRNLTNAEGRLHASFTKDQVPLPGRDIRFVLRAGF